MKTLREYIDIIKENEQQDWKQVIANEIKVRGLPKRVSTYVYTNYGFTYQIPEDLDYQDRDGDPLTDIDLDISTKGCQIVCSPDPDGDGNLPSPLAIYGMGDPNGAPSYTDLNGVLSCITSLCQAQQPDEPFYIDYNGRETLSYTFNGEYASDEEVEALSQYLQSKYSYLEGDWDYAAIWNYCRQECGNYDPEYVEYSEYYDIDQFNECQVEWPGLTIKLKGPNPQISGVEGELSTAKEPTKPTQAKPTKPQPKQSAVGSEPVEPKDKEI